MGLRHVVEWVAVGTIAGELIVCDGSWQHPALVAWSALAAGVAMVAMAGRWRHAAAGAVGSGLAGAALGMALAARATAIPADPGHVARLPLPLRCRVTGSLAATPERSGDGSILYLRAERIDGEGGSRAVSGLVRLRVRGWAGDLERGERLRVDTTLRRPRNFENPGRFDMVGRLARRGVHAVGSVWDPATIEHGGRVAGSWMGGVDRWRALVRASLAVVGEDEARGVLEALVLGDDGGLPAELRRAFTRAGVVHVLSVSGLHVGIVAGAAALAIGWALRRSERVLLRFDVRKIALTASLLPALGYATLAGLEVATLRSVAMVAAVATAALLERRAGALRALSLAALGIAVALPGSPAEISYQLSFASVASLVAGVGRAGSPGTGRVCSRVLGSVRLALAAWVGTAPLTAFHFHQLSLVAVVANPIVVPLFGAAALLPALAASAIAPLSSTAAGWGFSAAVLPVRAGVALVRAIGAWRWAAVEVPLPTVVELALLYGVIAGAWWRRHAVGRLVGAASLCLLALDAGAWAVARTTSRMRATFLDVGQGDATVVELSGGRVLVMDAGGFAGSDFDTGAAVVEPFLRSRKIQSIDVLAMSHAHPDHAGGLAHLVRAFAPAELWWTGAGGEGVAWADTVQALRAVGTPVRVLHAGDRLVDFPEVDVLHPPGDWVAPSLNEGSLVLRIRHGAVTLVLAGDAERLAEATMVDGSLPLTGTVLKVPHHGSRTSSTWPFVRAVAPMVAVASLGAENRFGHPSPEVAERYEAIGARWLRTDRCGAVTVESDGRGVTVTAARPDCAPPPTLTTPRRP